MRSNAAPSGSRSALKITPINAAQFEGASVGERLVYAIGDLHGRLDLLTEMIVAILDDVVQSAPARRPLIIFLGDYIDRGPQSAALIDFLISLQADQALEVRTLRGNHEQVLLDFLEREEEVGPDWVSFGGAATLAAYGVKSPGPEAQVAVWKKAAKSFERSLPAKHLAFLRATESLICVGDFAFVHAGVRPDIPLDRQTAHDVMWIRERFTDAQTPYEKVVVHGHTETSDVVVTRWRIGLDTAAYSSGVLSALRLHGANLRILQLRPAGQ